jgi:lipocalin-like protein
MGSLIVNRVFASMIAAMLLAAAAEKITKAQLVGSWSLVSTENTLPDGTRFSPFENGRGMLVFDRAGRFSWIVLRGEIPKFASGNRTKGTPEEMKGVAVGTLAYFGTYSLDPKGDAMTMHIEASTFANFDGRDQKRSLGLKGDELKISNSAGASGGTAVVRWKRLK